MTIHSAEIDGAHAHYIRSWRPVFSKGENGRRELMSVQLILLDGTDVYIHHARIKIKPIKAWKQHFLRAYYGAFGRFFT